MPLYPAPLPSLTLVQGEPIGGSAKGAAPLPSLSTLLEVADDVAQVGLFYYQRSNQASSTATRLLVGRRLPAAVGSFALSGQEATLPAPAGSGGVEWPGPLPMFSLVLTGITGQYNMPAEVGQFTYMRSDHGSRTATTLIKGRGLIADVGRFTFTGAEGKRDLELKGEYGAFYLYGNVAGLPVSKRFSADYGSYSYTGYESSGTVENATSKVLSCEAGSFTYMRSDHGSRTATTFLRGGVLTCDVGTFAYTGAAVEMTGPRWRDEAPSSGTWVYVTPSGGVWTDVDPDS